MFINFIFRLGSTCNHVASLIFKVDHAYMMGISRNQSLPCTSKVCQWNVYSGGAAAVLEGKPVSEMHWVKHKFKGRPKTQLLVKKKKIISNLKCILIWPFLATEMDTMSLYMNSPYARWVLYSFHTM